MRKALHLLLVEDQEIDAELLLNELDRIGYEGSARGGASALFWIFCLLAGLAVGVGAYWLVLELGK